MITSIIPCIDLIFLGWLVHRIFKSQPIPIRKYYWPALAVKLIAGLMLGVVYFWHYGHGDTIVYWQDANKITGLLSADPGSALDVLWNDQDFSADGITVTDARSLFFVKLVSLISLLCGGNYWVMSMMMSSIAFLCAWYLFVKVLSIFPDKSFVAAVAFLFFPSIVFWSSGIMKESIGLASIYFLSGLVLTLYDQKKPSLRELIGASIFLWIGWNLKYYWVGVFIPIAVATLLITQITLWRPAMERYGLLLWPGLCVIFFLLVSFIHPNFYLDRVSEVVWQNNQEFMKLSAPGHAIQYNDLQPSFQSMLLNAPQSLIGVLFRPFVWEAHDALSLVAAIENLAFMILMLMALTSTLQLRRAQHRSITLAVISYSILLGVFLALSTPNLGTLSRYKVGFLPFLVFLILCSNPFLNFNRPRK